MHICIYNCCSLNIEEISLKNKFFSDVPARFLFTSTPFPDLFGPDRDSLHQKIWPIKWLSKNNPSLFL